MNRHKQHHGKHDHKHSHAHQKKGHRMHKNWKTWVVIILMLAAMLMYVVSDDEALPPGDPDAAGQPVPAAAE